MDMDAAVRRVLSTGAIGIGAASSGRFFVRFEPLKSEYESFVELAFNPEYVCLSDEHPTDVYLSWGKMNHVAEDLRQLISDFGIQLCPVALESRARQVLFGEGRSECVNEMTELSWAQIAETLM